jgi:DNA topoisomerase-1
MPETLQPIIMKKSQLKKLEHDPEATAKAVRLVYVHCGDDGINRVKAGKGFTYKYQDKPVKNKTELQRIRSLVLPPAWEAVWICTLPNGHLQATGKDDKKEQETIPLSSLMESIED